MPLHRALGSYQPYYLPGSSACLLVFAGLVFGSGASFKGGCNIGTLARLARGEGNLLFAVLGWGVGLLLSHQLDH